MTEKNKSEKSVAEIRREYQEVKAADLSSFISQYQQDQRNGVRSIVTRAQTALWSRQKEAERIEGMLGFERKYGDLTYICGIDEAGRGPLAGPVAAAAVILKKDARILYVNDSKKLSEKKREELFDLIMEQAEGVGVGLCEAERIDQINILQATYEAMTIAVQKLPVMPDILLNDAVTIPNIGIRQVGIIKGDSISLSIAAASIIAKVTRDRIMKEYDRKYPQYGFAAHKGYGSKAHVEAIRTYGPSPLHRLTFLKQIL